MTEAIYNTSMVAGQNSVEAKVYETIGFTKFVASHPDVRYRTSDMSIYPFNPDTRRTVLFEPETKRSVVNFFNLELGLTEEVGNSDEFIFAIGEEADLSQNHEPVSLFVGTQETGLRFILRSWLIRHEPGGSFPIRYSRRYTITKIDPNDGEMLLVQSPGKGGEVTNLESRAKDNDGFNYDLPLRGRKLDVTIVDGSKLLFDRNL